MLGSRTTHNLLVALRGEAFAHARYSSFAAAARERGDERLAAMFEDIAAAELHEHFRELADLAGLVGSDADNLAVALRDEHAEVETSYPEFAAQARADSDEKVAARFEEIAADEREHAEALEAALARLGVTA
jgi:rubrerythrin